MAQEARKGKCNACGGKHALPATISKHVLTCSNMTTHISQAASGVPLVPGYLLKIQDKYRGKKYWLLVTIPKTMTLKVLDRFLRAIWVECCHHLSEFCLSRRGPMKKNKSIEEAFLKGKKFDYSYDMGDTTYIQISAECELPNVPSNQILVLSRNDSTTQPCKVCESADAVCWAVNTERHRKVLMCEGCKAEHTEKAKNGAETLPAHIYFLPFDSNVINSPRMGSCGYDGSHENVVSYIDSGDDSAVNQAVDQADADYRAMLQREGLDDDDDDDDDEDDDDDFDDFEARLLGRR